MTVNYWGLRLDTLQDNVIDWPLSFATRLGFNPEKTIGRAVDKIAGVGHAIKDKFNFVVDYESFMHNQKDKANMVKRQERRDIARLAADYVDTQKTNSQLMRKTNYEVQKQGIKMVEHPLYSRLYELNKERDEKAYMLLQKSGEKIPQYAVTELSPDAVKRAANRHEEYLIVKAIAQAKELKPGENLSLAKKAYTKIDLNSDDGYLVNHINSESQRNGLTSDQLSDRIEHYQDYYGKVLLKSLKNKHPVLEQYMHAVKQRDKMTGLNAEIFDKELSKMAKEIVANKPLAKIIQDNFTNLTKSLKKSLSLGRERGIER